jgi:hypothetical protein
MNEKALIEIFAGMASLVCLVSGLHRDARRKIAIRVATIRRTKVGYQQIQRQNEMALSPPYAFTFAIDRYMDCESAAKLLTNDEARRIAANVRHAAMASRLKSCRHFASADYEISLLFLG